MESADERWQSEQQQQEQYATHSLSQEMNPLVSRAFANEPPTKLTLESVFRAYFSCRKNKRNTPEQLEFESNLERNCIKLWQDLKTEKYRIGKSIAFVITFPKTREVWAAMFRDRVVHHLVYNAIKDRFFRRFIRDSYACIPGRGTLDGCRRLEHFSRSASQNWTLPAFALKADIESFFRSIDRNILFERVKKHVFENWLLRLIEQVVFHDPCQNAIFQSTADAFSRVPKHKSLFYAPKDFGLPIGNLTSQFFANVYLDMLDQYAKRTLKIQYYCRYVDDIVILGKNPKELDSWYKSMSAFLNERLNMRFHPQKKVSNTFDRG